MDKVAHSYLQFQKGQICPMFQLLDRSVRCRVSTLHGFISIFGWIGFDLICYG